MSRTPRPAALVSAMLAFLALLALGASFLDGSGALGIARAALAILALALLPGLLALRLVAAPWRAAGSGVAIETALALALAPFVSGACMTLLLFTGLPVGAASRAFALLLAAGFAFDGWRRRAADAADEADRADPDASRRLGAAPVAIALGLALVVALPLLKSERVRVSIHGLLHTALLDSVAETGLPPENPFFAGEAVRYYWTWHAGTAATCWLGDVDPTIAFAAGNVAALAAFLLLLGAAGRELFAGVARAANGPALAIAASAAVAFGFLGLDPIGGFLFPLRERAGTFADLAQGANPINVLDDLAVGGELRITATLTKFLNVSSFPAALALLAATWFLLPRVVRRPGWPGVATLLFATAGSIVLSPITGLCAGFALGGGVLVALAFARGEAGGADRRGLFAALGALAGGLALALPFVLLGIAGTSGSAAGLEPVAGEPPAAWLPTFAKLVRMAANAGPVALLALPAIVVLARRKDAAGRALVVAALLLALQGIVVGLPVASEYKLVRMAAPLFGVLAGGTFLLLAERKTPRDAAVLAAFAVVPFLPTNAIAWAAYAAHARADVAVRADGVRLVREDLEPRDDTPSGRPLPKGGIGAMYEWIRAHTPADAVIVDHWRHRDAHVGGRDQGAELPPFAHRPVYTDDVYYMTDYEPELALRRRLVERVFDGIALDRADVERLKALRRPIYLLVRAADVLAKPVLEAAIEASGQWQVAHRTRNACLYELR